MKVHKQVYDLTLEDITTYPIWEYALVEEAEEGQDEATVRPVEPPSLDLTGSHYLIRARFILANGANHVGLITITQAPDDGIIKIDGDTYKNADRNPSIITPRGQVIFYYGGCGPNDEDLTNAYQVLGAHTSAIPCIAHPLHVSSFSRYSVLSREEFFLTRGILRLAEKIK